MCPKVQFTEWMFRLKLPFMIGGHGHVVIIDDDPGMGQAIERLCRASDLPCRVFKSAEDFLAAGDLANTRFLVLDIRLPGMSGFALHDLLKSRGHNLPVAFITAHDLPGTRQRAAESGATTFLCKPFPGNHLLDAILAHFSQLPRQNHNPPYPNSI